MDIEMTLSAATTVAKNTRTKNYSDSTLGILADYAFSLKLTSLSDSTLNMVRNCVLDLVTAAVAGANADGARATRVTAMSSFGSGTSSLWFSGAKLPAAAAVLANCTAASILDLDDGHRAASGHPGAAIIPCCLAVAEEVGASWNELVAAIVVGYEISVRVSASRHQAKISTEETGDWVHFGVAAAVGRLRGLNRKQLEQAMAIAGCHGPNKAAIANTQKMADQIKEGIPWSSLTGVLAVDLARAGFTGTTNILDKSPNYDAEVVLQDLGQSCLIDRVYFKPYSCCRWIHGPIDGVIDIMTSNNLRPDTIKSIEIHTFTRALNLNNETNPMTLEGAQYSLPYCLGVVAVYGAKSMLPIKAEHLHDPIAVDIAKKVQLNLNESYDALYPEKTAARIVLHTASESYSREVLLPFGDADNPMSNAQLWDKFADATQGLPVEDISKGISAFDDGDYLSLVQALATYKCT